MIAPYALHRNPRYFSPLPEEYIPERWLPSSEPQSEGEIKYSTNREAFIPFSHGPANCAGKALALLELRYIVALLVLCFDLHHTGCKEATTDETLKNRAKAWMGRLKDRFVFGKSELLVDLALRRKSL